MPVLDMPLKALQEYRGSSPKPEDFDSYWERALEEMNSINPDLEDKNSFENLFLVTSRIEEVR